MHGLTGRGADDPYRVAEGRPPHLAHWKLPQGWRWGASSLWLGIHRHAMEVIDPLGRSLALVTAHRPEHRQWLEAEARLVGMLRHRLIPTTYTYWPSDAAGTPGGGYTRAWIEGAPFSRRLGQRVGQHLRMPVQPAMALTRTLGACLHLLHESGAAHGAISPDRVWETPTGEAWLLGWHWAVPAADRPAGESPDPRWSLVAPEWRTAPTRTPTAGMKVQTLDALRAEMLGVARGERPAPADAAMASVAPNADGTVPASVLVPGTGAYRWAPTALSDQWQLAAFAVALMLGEMPSDLGRGMDDAMDRLEATRKDCPVAVRELLRRALATNPEDRWPSVAIFLRGIERAIGHVPLSLPPNPLLTQQAKRLVEESRALWPKTSSALATGTGEVPAGRPLGVLRAEGAMPLSVTTGEMLRAAQEGVETKLGAGTGATDDAGARRVSGGMDVAVDAGMAGEAVGRDAGSRASGDEGSAGAARELELSLRRATGLDYELLSQLGTGTFGVVWRARDLTLDREVAIKALWPDRVADPRAIQRFRLEARMLARIAHPRVLPVYDFEERDGLAYLVMELAERGSLADRLTRAGSLTLEEIAPQVDMLFEALGTAHAAGVVHRDLKPENILIDRSGRYRIADWGLAARPEDTARVGSGVIPREPTQRAFHTAQAAHMRPAPDDPTAGYHVPNAGTPAFAAPEQLLGASHGPSVDCFALAAIVVTALGGGPPFGEGDETVILGRMATGRARHMDRLTPSIRAWCLRALAYEADDRFGSAEAHRAAWKDAVAASTAPEGSALKRLVASFVGRRG